MRTRLLASLAVYALGACTHDLTVYDQVDAQASRALDVLYVFDDSADRGNYDRMAAQLDDLQAQLTTVDGALPSLHVGVVTADLGTRGVRDPQPGPAFGHCAGNGDAGALTTFGAGLTFGRFLQDQPAAADRRIRNFDASLGTALARLTNPAVDTASAGCEISQPLEAMRRALDPATNPGFVRADAALAIIFLTNKDDCSLARSAMLDPFDTSLGSSIAFRCTEQGIVCDGSDLRTPGARTHCRPREASPFLVDVSEYRTFLAGLKPDAADITVSAVAGARDQVQIAAGPTLAPACQGGGNAAQPAVRLGALVDAFGGATVDACTQDAAYQQIAAPIARRQRACFPNLDAASSCTVREVSGAATVELPQCTDGGARPCWYRYVDAATCPDGAHVGLGVDRGDAPPPASSRLQATCDAR